MFKDGHCLREIIYTPVHGLPLLVDKRNNDTVIINGYTCSKLMY